MNPDFSAFSAPVVFSVEGLGEVTVQARQRLFHTWLKAGREQNRWLDGAALMRDMLREQALDANGVALDGAAVAALAPETLEAAAGAFLEVPDTVIGPIGGGEANVKAEDESQLARFKRVLLAKAEAANALRLKIREEIALPARMLRQALGPMHHILEQQKRMDPLLPPLREMERLAMVPGSAYQSLRAIDDVQRRLIPDVSRLSAAATVMSRMQESVRGIVDDMNPLKAYPHFRTLGEMTRPLGVERLFEDATSVSNLLRRQFDLRLPMMGAAAVGASYAAEIGIAQRLAESYLRPGFQATVVAAVEGLAARGAAADVLGHYGLTVDDDAPVFAAVMEGVTALDDEDAQAGTEQFEAALARFTELVTQALARQGRPITLMGVFNVGTLMVTLASCYFGFAAWQGDVAERAKPPESAAIIAKLDALQRAVEPDLRGQRDVRYVHERAWLRAEPAADALELRAVYPDQPVRVLETTERWAKVEVHDYASDGPMVGWISRRRLRLTPLY